MPNRMDWFFGWRKQEVAPEPDVAPPSATELKAWRDKAAATKITRRQYRALELLVMANGAPLSQYSEILDPLVEAGLVIRYVDGYRASFEAFEKLLEERPEA